MSILDIFKKKSPAAGSAHRNAHPPAGNSNKPRGDQGVAGYGANPYDTYTWELHTDQENGERQLKRAHVIDKPKPDGETFNPYDTGKFSGGW
ncbi:MAG: hypothetical protein KJ040_10065 [Gammaproteobacteria bacterium]|nr:hypothetical protein [Gammaproteobacteria bacterium]